MAWLSGQPRSSSRDFQLLNGVGLTLIVTVLGVTADVNEAQTADWFGMS